MKEQPALGVVELLVAKLVPYANNAKEHSARQVDAIAASIAEFWFWGSDALTDNPTAGRPATPTRPCRWGRTPRRVASSFHGTFW